MSMIAFVQSYNVIIYHDAHDGVFESRRAEFFIVLSRVGMTTKRFNKMNHHESMVEFHCLHIYHCTVYYQSGN